MRRRALFDENTALEQLKREIEQLKRERDDLEKYVNNELDNYTNREIKRLKKERDETKKNFQELNNYISCLEQIVKEVSEGTRGFRDDTARDEFILEAYRRGTKLCSIRATVNKCPLWTSLGTDSAVRHAMARYCKRKGITPPRRKP